MTAPKLRLIQQHSDGAADKSSKSAPKRTGKAKSVALPASEQPAVVKKTAAAKAPRTHKKPLCAADLMTSPVVFCSPADSLNWAAQLLWEYNLGALVVVNAEQAPISMITDRDICFATYTQGLPLWESSVSSAMSQQVVVCAATASLAEVRQLMTSARVRRLPIVDESGKLVGIVGLGDLCRQDAKASARATAPAELMQLVSAWVSAP